MQCHNAGDGSGAGISTMPGNKLKQTLINTPRPLKQALAVFVDLLLLLLSSQVVMAMRLETVSVFDTPDVWMFGVGAAIVLPVFTKLGLYRAIFRYAGLQVVFALNKALAVYTMLYVLVFTVVGVSGVPRSLGLAQPMLFAFLVMSSRLITRYWLGGMGLKARLQLARPVLIYGAGSAGRQLANSIYQSQELVAVGYVDDDDRLHGHSLNGLTIYNPQALAQVVADKQVGDVYLALPSVPRKRRGEIIEALKCLPVKVLTLPGLMDLASGKVAVSDLKELDIEDLLGRESVSPNPLLMGKNITHKVVVVTGAGGSIGSELCRQILKVQPVMLLLVESSEFALYQIEMELRNALAELSEQRTQLVALLANVQDESRMAQIMRTWRPHTVYHAAAYKHVPLVEHNPAEGIRNNVWGTLTVAQQAQAHGVKNVVLISTDKAVRPTNIMGATKRIAEMGLQALAAGQAAGAAGTTFSMVRFGNVLGSSGSVVPLFRKQIANGGPITLTDERITRYFMTIPEAAQLVIQAGAMASGGEVFVLDMGESVRIMDLARKMIELSGLQVQDAAHPDGDIAIEVTGLRPGEKLYEELLIGDNPQPTHHPRIMKATEEFLPWPQYVALIDQLQAGQKAYDVPQMCHLIGQLVPGYRPEGGIVDWVTLAQA
jgi:FlaA1/EpsC-like NDP-sugar epimerase